MVLRPSIGTFILAICGASAAVAQDDPGVCVRYCDIPSPPQPQKPAKSDQQLRDERDARWAGDAAADGEDALNRGDYAAALRNYEEAAQIDPNDPAVVAGLAKARSGLAARQAVAVSHDQAAQVFDGQGTAADFGGIAPVSADRSGNRDPVVPLAKLTPVIRDLEAQRAATRNHKAALQAKIAKLNPKKDSVQISKLRNEETADDHKVHFLNFSINQELAKGPHETTLRR